jgi:hypothetical protein
LRPQLLKELENDSKNAITIFQLKRLIYDLKHKQSYTCMRLRLLGEMWETSFLQIVSINEDTAIFSTESTGKFLIIERVANIMQFEIDHGFQNYKPHYHYNVILDDVEVLG